MVVFSFGRCYTSACGNEIQITISFGLFNRSLHEPKAQMMCFGMKRINLLRFQRRLSNYGTI